MRDVTETTVQRVTRLARSGRVCHPLDALEVVEMLTASQAREVALRDLVTRLDTLFLHGYQEFCAWKCSHAACDVRRSIGAEVGSTLAAPQDTTALREFGLRVARETYRECSRNDADASTVVDAVLAGRASP